MYRSLCRLVSRRLDAAVPATRFVKGAATVTGDAAGWRVDRARASLGASRRRATIHGRWNSGCVPGRCFFNDRINPASASGVYCGSFQSYYAMGFLQIWVVAGVHCAGNGQRWSSPMRLMCTVARDVICIFYRGFCASSLGQLSPYPVPSYLYLLVSLYVVLV